MRTFLTLILLFATVSLSAKIDRKAVVSRNNPHVTSIDTLASLSVGNGEFAFTCDVTGLQTFHRLYAKGVPLGTMAQWGWHSFPNEGEYKPEEVLRNYDFGRGHEEWYSCQLKDERGKAASDYLRSNPHRLHLGITAFKGMEPQDLTDINQTLDLWNGMIHSSYTCQGHAVTVTTHCHPQRDRVAAEINDPCRHAVQLLFPYPTGNHSDNACDWSDIHPHRVEQVASGLHGATFRHTLDRDSYYIRLCWKNADAPKLEGKVIEICPKGNNWSLSVEYMSDSPAEDETDFKRSATETARFWNRYWQEGGIVDFGLCTDPRACELERRVVLSQYLLAIQCAGSTPPQETGLTYNSWFGKFHLEMTWWHQAHFALWNHPEMLARTLPWYEKAAPMARSIAARQGFEGLRWMKMTDPSAAEAPSNVGSFLIWQQPHFIYLCELLYRATHDLSVIRRYYPLVEQTAQFMASFATYDPSHGRYVLKGCIPAQETLKAADTVNPPFELSYWHFALQVAQAWRERLGMAPDKRWANIIERLAVLTEKDGVYAAAETAASYPSLVVTGSDDGKDSFEASALPQDIKLYSDHMAVLGACGVLPHSPLCSISVMHKTLLWVMDNWNWDKTWGWDFPTTCMTAVRTHDPDVAIDALLKDCRTNTYLPNGHNYQDSRLRCYLPGNGGLLTAVALMCAGYDGCNASLPGFPKNGKWNVRYEGIHPLP